jgi:hypothetical protein
LVLDLAMLLLRVGVSMQSLKLVVPSNQPDPCNFCTSGLLCVQYVMLLISPHNMLLLLLPLLLHAGVSARSLYPQL